MHTTAPHRVQVQQVLDGMFQQRHLLLDMVFLEFPGIDTQSRRAIDDGDSHRMGTVHQTAAKTEQQVAIEGFALEQADHSVLNDTLSGLSRIDCFGKSKEFCRHVHCDRRRGSCRQSSYMLRTKLSGT